MYLQKFFEPNQSRWRQNVLRTLKTCMLCPLVMVSMLGPEKDMQDKTVYQNESILTQFVFHQRQLCFPVEIHSTFPFAKLEVKCAYFKEKLMFFLVMKSFFGRGGKGRGTYVVEDRKGTVGQLTSGTNRNTTSNCLPSIPHQQYCKS
jgi:hypothetical protein